MKIVGTWKQPSGCRNQHFIEARAKHAGHGFFIYWFACGIGSTMRVDATNYTDAPDKPKCKRCQAALKREGRTR